MPTPASNAVRTLRLCAQMERKVGDLYRGLAELHTERRDLWRLWTKTAREEDNHARQFDMAVTYGERVGEVTITTERATELLRVVSEVCERVRAKQPLPIEALEAALSIEGHLAEFHMTNAATFPEANVKKLFEAMMAADREHVESLRKQLEIERASY